MDRTEQLLRNLTQAHGLPGYEAEIRALVRRCLEPMGHIEQDRIGSIICRSGDDGPRVMLAAHMDEIGLMVNHMTDEGFLRFLPLGSWWGQVLLGQRVIVKTGKGDLRGVVGTKPPHMLEREEKYKGVELKDMYIDIGATSKAELEEAGVRLGDPAAPDASFQTLLNGRVYMAKAFDDRVGVALMIEAMRCFFRAPHPNVLFGAGTVMEEVGCRGGRTSANVVDPEAAVILECDVCGDVPGINPEESRLKLGGGPSLVLMESGLIPNLKFRDLVIDTARELDIPLQFSAGLGGSTDGGRIHLHGGGVPTVVLGVPARYIHTVAGILHRDDFDRALRLLVALIGKLDAETVAGLTGK